MRRTILLALAATLAACTTSHTKLSGALKLGSTPEENYKNGLDELKNRHYPEATRFFEYVKAKYPFSNLSLLSDLQLADVKFSQGRYPEAAEDFEKFAKDHPSADENDYAQYRAGLSHLRSAPGDFFLFPPLEEKDQRETEKAVATLRDFVQKRPGSQYLDDAKKSLATGEGILARREMRVGDYYFKRKEWAGAAGRYKEISDSYPATALVEPALVKLAQAYVRMNEKFQARQALQQLLTQHPESRERPAAEKLLESLR
jgi:outer membrane protein assembly factor BamD